MDNFDNVWQFADNEVQFAKLNALKRRKVLNSENFLQGLNQYVKIFIPEVGERMKLIESILGVESEARDKNNENKENKLDASNKYVVKFISDRS